MILSRFFSFGRGLIDMSLGATPFEGGVERIAQQRQLNLRNTGFTGRPTKYFSTPSSIAFR